MGNSSPFVGRVGDYFGITNAPHAEVSPLGILSFSVTRIVRNIDDWGHPAVNLPKCACYFVMLYMADASLSDVASDGSLKTARTYNAGTLCLVDLEQGTSIYLHTPLDAIALTIPKALLLEVSRMPKAPVFSKLRSERGTADPTMDSLATSLRAHLESDKSAESRALKHLAIAICAHLLQTYGKCPIEQPGDFGRLNADQIAKAQLYIVAHLRQQISAAEIANDLGITDVEFEEGLINSVGYDRVELVNRTRLESAKALLQTGRFTVKSIVDECGFESEKSFLEAFTRCTGMLPEQWQKSLRH